MTHAMDFMAAGLINGVTYNVSVQAFSCSGVSDIAWVAAAPAPTAPGPPRAVLIAATSQDITVSWLSPNDDGGAGSFRVFGECDHFDSLL